jgi:hypothetical protein
MPGSRRTNVNRLIATARRLEPAASVVAKITPGGADEGVSQMRLDGKVAIVTGATKGIGRVIAATMAA